MGLTPKGKETLTAISNYVGQHGVAPTYRELMPVLGLRSLNAVHQRVTALRLSGHLAKGRKGAARELVPRAIGAMALPSARLTLQVRGHIAAGKPIEAVDYDKAFEIPHGLVGDPDKAYLLVVEGDSMVGEHILDGDMILVERRSQFPPGAIVVALVDGWEATVKRAYPLDNNLIRLAGANPDHEDTTYSRDRVEIQGVVAGVLRQVLP